VVWRSGWIGNGYGDAGYGLKDVIMSSYRAGRGTELGADEGIFNASMSRQRIAVEWGFGKVVNLFGLIDSSAPHEPNLFRTLVS
jgi:hypothetical protein